jgi:hypothetical protein
MNRQIRRAQAKLDKKAELEKTKKKEARRERIDTLKRRRTQRRELARTEVGRTPKPDPDRPLTEAERKRLPGRFSGALMIATVFFIVLQAAVPMEQAGTGTSLVGAGYLLLFGYFSIQYLLRRDTPRAFTMTLISGVALAVGVGAARLFSGQQIDWLMLGLGSLGVVAGAYLGRMVFSAARP